MPKAGDIAICSRGLPGLITCDEPQEVTYPDGNKGVAWTGIHLSPPYGTPWSSRNPVIIGHVGEMTRKATKVVCHTCLRESTPSKPLTFVHDVYGIKGYRECTDCDKWDRKIKVGCLIAVVLFIAVIIYAGG